ncbi:MAG: extracellular solute-binding protein, partial [Oscillospiraceae bacterium]|nr:extracellular solute-binding protein [Oscillospiraceae bacterium]
DYFYVNSFMPTDDGKYLLLFDSKIFVTDDSGALLNTIEYGAADDNTYMYGLYKTGDGRIVTYVSISKQVGNEWESSSKIVVVDTANNKFGDEFEFKGGSSSFINGTEKYDLLISKESGLAGYDIESGNTETIIDWLKSGFDSTTMNGDSTTVLPDGRILCVTYNYQFHGGGSYSWGGNDMVISILTEVDPATLPDKKLIKFYALWLDIGVKRQVLEFNKNNLEYEIELTCYGDDMDWQDAISKMNNDMISGNLPDILLINSNLPVDSYISKGLFANLYDFMETDPDISKDDFLPNLFKAYEVNGALYYTVPEFTISTIVGKTSDVGAEQGWTMDEFMALVEANPDKSVFGDERYATNTNMLSTFFSYNYDSFINRDTGECSFNSDAFIKMMEFCNRFPSETNDGDTAYDDAYWNNYWQEYDSQWRTGKTLLSN